MKRKIWGAGKLCIMAMMAFLASQQRAASAPSFALYHTGFEAAEGYSRSADSNLDLGGQVGWIEAGSDQVGANGIVYDFFPGYGQQAYIGYAPTAAGALYSVWKPINLAPIPTNISLIQFSTLMEIVDSTTDNGNYDDFSWTLYNSSGKRLFTLDFDNWTTTLYYLLEDQTNYQSIGRFANGQMYRLQITMDFAHNRWQAMLDDTVVATNLPITTTNSPINLGYMAAEWSIYTPGQPGDNYMLFDEYQIVAEYVPPRIFPFHFSQGVASGQVLGVPGLHYALEVSPNLKTWTALSTNIANASGTSDFNDFNARAASQFYRARVVP